ncbi:uncharacterized protein [Triticum aestivum]|uniref:uncharacterized protein isoform X1 n=2 Tax=Triticum aestivum TaxID=4565 RepID=UPI001D013B40|nr:uncharacterized protein LOC123160972 isoform X1 [Triticum aestivum]
MSWSSQRGLQCPSTDATVPPVIAGPSCSVLPMRERDPHRRSSSTASSLSASVRLEAGQGAPSHPFTGCEANETPCHQIRVPIAPSCLPEPPGNRGRRRPSDLASTVPVATASMDHRPDLHHHRCLVAHLSAARGRGGDQAASISPLRPATIAVQLGGMCDAVQCWCTPARPHHLQRTRLPSSVRFICEVPDRDIEVHLDTSSSVRHALMQLIHGHRQKNCSSPPLP